MNAKLKTFIEKIPLQPQMKEVVERVQAETPVHFKRVRTFGLILMGVGILAKVVLAIFPGTMPIGIAALAGDIIWLGGGMAGVATTARK